MHAQLHVHLHARKHAKTHAKSKRAEMLGCMLKQITYNLHYIGYKPPAVCTT